MKSLLLYRHQYLTPEVLGHLMIFEDQSTGGSKMIFECKTLELGWKNNERRISCVPSGFYNLEFEYSPKFDRNLWELKGVPNRSEAKIHVANFFRQIEGCIAVGDMHINIDDDGFPDVRNSKNTLGRLHDAMGNDTKATLRIVGKA